jgi:hypothetical protein
MSEPTDATGRTPAQPDNDEPTDGDHAGESQQEASGRTPGTADVDHPDDGVHTGNDPTEE